MLQALLLPQQQASQPHRLQRSCAAALAGSFQRHCCHLLLLSLPHRLLKKQKKCAAETHFLQCL
jgi:hypothetical protein